MTLQRDLRVIEADEMELYPISCKDRLDSHYFVLWNCKRWAGSDFRRRAYSDTEVGFYGFELFMAAQLETPVGTLPRDNQALAFLLRMSLEKFHSLMRRDLTPLHGWYEVMCDNGEIRLANKVVTEVAMDALTSKRRNAAKNAEDRMRKRLNTICEALREKIPGGARIAASEERVNQISDWIAEAYPGGSATVNRIREALNALC